MHKVSKISAAKLAFFALFLIFLSACKKDEIVRAYAPDYNDVPTVLLENYVNRIYIDLLGREPLDTEMAAEVALLRKNNLDIKTRESIAYKLQNDTAFRDGDLSYKIAYYHRFYELCKGRVLESATLGEMEEEYSLAYNNYLGDSAIGDTAGMQFQKEIIRKIIAIERGEEDYRTGKIDFVKLYAQMIDNAVYDKINMNAFNFVNATFDNLFFRFPTKQEFTAGYTMVEYNRSAVLFGGSGQNKGDYIKILSNSTEFYQGMVVWVYKTLMNREPSSMETYTDAQALYTSFDIQALQRKLIKSDEYAHFKAL